MPTTAATASGTRSGSMGWIVSQSSSYESAPKGARAASTRPVAWQPGDPHPDRRLAQQVDQRAGGDDAAVVDDRDPVAQPLDLAQQVRVQEHRRSPLARLADDRPHVVAADRVERGGGLVEDHERGVAQERRREPEALLHALGEAAGPVAGAVGEPGERRGRVRSRPRGPWRAARRAVRAASAPRVRTATPGSGTARAGSRRAAASAGPRSAGRAPGPSRPSDA